MNDDRRRLPGSEKLTRPEDISALSKYLGNIKKIQEEHTTLDLDSLEVPGRTTGRIPKIDSLPDKKEGLDVNGWNGKELDNTRLDIKPDLDSWLEDLQVGLDDDREPELSDTKVDLYDDRETELEDSRVSLDDDREIKLGESRVGLDSSSSEVDELPENVIGVIPGTVGWDENTLYDSAISGPESKEPELSDTRLDLGSDKEVELGDKKEGLIGESPEITGLYDSVLKPSEDMNKAGWDGETLYDSAISGPEPDEPELSDAKVDLYDDRETKLDDSKVTLDTDSDIKLSDVVSELRVDQDDRELEIPDTKIELDADQDIELWESKIEIQDDREPELEGEKIIRGESVGDETWDGNKLGDYLSNLPDDKKYEKALELAGSLGPWGSKIAALISSVLSNDSVSQETAAWFDSELKKLLEQMGILDAYGIESFNNSGQRAQGLKVAESLDKFKDKILRPKVTSRSESTLREDLENATPEDDFLRKYGEGSSKIRPIGVDEDRSGVNDREELAEQVMRVYNKPASIFDKTGGNRSRGYQNIPTMKLPERGALGYININNYIRYCVELLFSFWNPSSTAERNLKPRLIDESIALLILGREQLEKASKSNRDRLPGDDVGMLSDLVSSGASGMIGNLKDNLVSSVQDAMAGSDGVAKKDPLNRPKTHFNPIYYGDGSAGGWIPDLTTEFEKGNNRQDANKNSVDLDQVGKNLGKNVLTSLVGNLDIDNLGPEKINFINEYVANKATIVTLQDLCLLKDWKQVDSLETLNELIKSSLTTPAKFGTIESGRYGTMTLDTNSYWEITMEPFCHKTMNGGYSFLPSVKEINFQNISEFGVTTAYDRWIPVINFDLVKSKIENKNLSLYGNGEMYYPVHSAAANELRLTIVDDQYKSWRTYFQKCADVSVFSSEAHNKDFYSNPDHITVVDTEKPVAALYKNITFLISIYVMTPQYATIRRFRLLCVLRDFEEAYTGDIDAGGIDLTVSFSIVGENPINEEGSVVLLDIDDAIGGELDFHKYGPLPPKKSGGLIKLL